MAQPAVLILAQSARMLAEVARNAGWSPYVVDLFGDVDTRQAAESCQRVCSEQGFEFGLDAIEAAKGFLQRDPAMPIVLGGGFENSPQLVAKLADLGNLHGASASIIRALRNVPLSLNELHECGVNVPITQWHRAAPNTGWLKKKAGASGGFHVQSLIDAEPALAGEYFQQRVDGPVFSTLFLASSETCRTLGYAQHLSWNPRADAQFHYQGAVLWQQPPSAVRAHCDGAGVVVAEHFGLRGLFGLDFVIDPERGPLLIDINPRPTATLELHRNASRLFNWHLDACAGRPLLYSKTQALACAGHMVVYANKAWQIPEGFAWPYGVKDRSMAGQLIAAGAPLCSLHAEAEQPGEVLDRLGDLLGELRALIGSQGDEVISTPTTIGFVGGP